MDAPERPGDGMNPWVIEDSISIAAGVTVDNVIALNNSLRGLMQAPFPFRGGLIAVQTVTGLRIDLSIGSKRLVYSSDLRVGTTFQDPDDVVNDEFFGQEGDIIALRAANPTGGAIVLRYRFVGMPVVDESWAPGSGAVQLPPDCLVMQRGAVSIANGTIDLDLLDNLDLQRLPYPVRAKFFMTASAAGMTRTLFIEQDRVAPPSFINITNRVPLDPFDMTIDGVEVPPNHDQKLQVTNQSGGALNAFWKQKCYEVYRR
jgi:hypothetical protein